MWIRHDLPEYNHEDARCTANIHTTYNMSGEYYAFQLMRIPVRGTSCRMQSAACPFSVAKTAVLCFGALHPFTALVRLFCCMLLLCGPYNLSYMPPNAEIGVPVHETMLQEYAHAAVCSELAKGLLALHLFHSPSPGPWRIARCSLCNLLFHIC